MQKTTLSIPNISCGHCVMTIKNELSRMEGVRQVTGDPGNKRIEVQWDLPATLERIEKNLKEINYPAI